MIKKMAHLVKAGKFIRYCLNWNNNYFIYFTSLVKLCDDLAKIRDEIMRENQSMLKGTKPFPRVTQ